MKRKLSLLVILTASFAFWACDKTGPVTPPDSTVAVQSVEIEPKEISLEIGISTKLTATVKPDNASDKTPAWSSDNTSVATVDAKGQVIGIAVGTANITLTVGGKTATCKVTVTQSAASLERAALVAIYNALNGDSWLHKEGWCSNQPLENWYGVTVDKGHVIALRLYNFGASGTIPPEIGNLTELQDLDITNNRDFEIKDYGPLPKEIGKLSKLKTLSFQNFPISGVLPEEMYDLTNLQQLIIQKPRFMDPHPISLSIGKLKNLRICILADMNLNGPLPVEFAQLSKLKELELHNNNLTGPIPEEWAAMAKSLDKLYLLNNQLSGFLPQFFFELNYPDPDWMSLILQQKGVGFDLSAVDIHIGGTNVIEGPVTDVNGKQFSFDNIIKGNKYTVYLVWESWCNISSALMPQVKDFYERYHKDGLEIIATSQVGSVDENGVGSLMSDYEGYKDEVNAKGYGQWYNFYWPDYRKSYLASSPNAEVYDQDGNVVFSTMLKYSDPVRRRFNKVASFDLIPFLESLFGPTDPYDMYSSTDFSQDGKVMTLQKASVGKGINIVFMGDAYTDRDISSGLYQTVMGQAMEEFFAVEPYATFRNRFNVYAVTAVSKNGIIAEGFDTAFGTYPTGGPAVGADLDKCYEYALKVPGIDDKRNLLVCVMLNTRNHYGVTHMSESLQSCIAFSSSYGNDRELFGSVVQHEAGGHGFAFLADEYSQNNITAPEDHIDYYNSVYNQYGWFPNVDFTNDPSKIRWNAFLSDDRYKNEVGIFEGGALYSKGAWRPTANSIMNMNMGGFNAPSRWAIYKRIMELSGESYSFESFLQYDAKNRGAKAASAPRLPFKALQWEPGAPPVIHR